MKISFFDDEPEIYPLQYGGKARTITNLAKEFVKLPEVEQVTILSKSIFSDKEKFIKDGVNYIALNDSNIIECLAKEVNSADILNIHCCSFTFPKIQDKAKKFYFLHDVLIATADKGSHLDKSLGGQFDAIIAPSEFAKSVYEKYRNIINGKCPCYVIPRNLDRNMFYSLNRERIKNDKIAPKLVKEIIDKYKYIIFFPSRPIEEKGGKYLKMLTEELNRKLDNYCVIVPFGKDNNLPKNFINTGWIKTEELKYYYSIANVTLNFSILPESFSQVCIESVACGTPVVAFPSGNIQNLSRLNDGIILVKKETKEILDGVLYALKVKENKIQIDKGKQKIIQEFDTRTVIQKYMKLYNKFMEE